MVWTGSANNERLHRADHCIDEVERLKEELAALIKYVQNNKACEEVTHSLGEAASFSIRKTTTIGSTSSPTRPVFGPGK